MDDAMVREISITRIFGAPRDLVWRAWTEAEQLAAWFMPHGFTVPECEVDLRVGGSFRMTVRAPDGTESPTGGEFKEIDPPHRLVFTTTGLDGPDGVPMLEVLNTATFADLGDKTELTLHAVVTKASPEMAAPLAGMEEGWLQSLEKLDGLLTGREVNSSEREMVVTRLLDAPRETVWKLWTDPAHIAEWWGPRGFTTTIHEMDVRPGGAWRHTMHGPDGADYPNSAVFLDVREPERIAFLHGDPGEPDHFFTTVDFADEGGKTGVTIRALSRRRPTANGRSASTGPRTVSRRTWTSWPDTSSGCGRRRRACGRDGNHGHGQCRSGDVAGRVHRGSVRRGRPALRLVLQRRRRVPNGGWSLGVQDVGGERETPARGLDQRRSARGRSRRVRQDAGVGRPPSARGPRVRPHASAAGRVAVPRDAAGPGGAVHVRD